MSLTDDLAALIESVSVGDTVFLTDHDYTLHTGPRTVTRVDAGTLYTARKGGRTSYLSWPVPGDDYEVSGRTLKIYRRYHAYTGGRAIVLTLTFN